MITFCKITYYLPILNFFTKIIGNKLRKLTKFYVIENLSHYTLNMVNLLCKFS